MNRICYIDRAQFSAWKRAGRIRRREGEQRPQTQPLTVIKGGESSFNVAQCAGSDQSPISKLIRPAVLRVHVAYDKARLKHPVKKWAEIVKVIWQLAITGFHLLSRTNVKH